MTDVTITGTNVSIVPGTNGISVAYTVTNNGNATLGGYTYVEFIWAHLKQQWWGGP